MYESLLERPMFGQAAPYRSQNANTRSTLAFGRLYNTIQIHKVLAKSGSIRVGARTQVSWLPLTCLASCFFRLGLDLLLFISWQCRLLPPLRWSIVEVEAVRDEVEVVDTTSHQLLPAIRMLAMDYFSFEIRPGLLYGYVHIRPSKESISGNPANPLRTKVFYGGTNTEIAHSPYMSVTRKRE